VFRRFWAWLMSLIGVSSSSSTPQPPGSAPVWNSTPAPNFADEAVSENYDLDQHTTGATSYALNGGSAALPTGVTVSGTNLAYDGLGSAGTTASVIIDATNADGTTASSAFTITITATATAVQFPLFAFYDAVSNIRGNSVIPASNTRFWDVPTYPTYSSGAETSISALNTAIAAASPGDTIWLADGTYSTNITIAVNGTSANPITVACQTKLGADMSGATVVTSGNYINVMGFEDAKHTPTGNDIVTSYCHRTGAAGRPYRSTGDRNRLTQCDFEGITGDDQYFRIGNGGISSDNRIDHNYFHDHTGGAAGGSEIGQIGQNEIGSSYRAYVDSNSIYRHLNNGDGVKTGAPGFNEGETITCKADHIMVVNNVMEECNTHMAGRAGRELTFWANWFIGGGAAQQGGMQFGGKSDLVGCNYADANHNLAGGPGDGFLNVQGGDLPISPGYREEASDSEVVFNTGYQIDRGIAFNRASRSRDPDGVYICSNAIEEESASNVIWNTEDTNTNYISNVFGANAGVADAGITEATPGWTATGGFQRPTVSGNLDGTSGNISTMGPMVIALDAAGALYDILGTTIPSTGADIGAIQTGFDLSTSPVTLIKNAAGTAPS